MMILDPSVLGVRRLSNLGLETDPDNDLFFTKKTPPEEKEENIKKMTEILTHFQVIADDKRKINPLSKSPKPVVYSHYSSGQGGRLIKATDRATNYDHQDKLNLPVQTLESITHIFSIVVKVLFGYEFSEKPPQDLLALKAEKNEYYLDELDWKEIKPTFEEEIQKKMDRAFVKVNNILISREKYLQNIHYHRIALAALSVITLVGMLFAKSSWTVLGLVACSVNVIFMFTHYISSTETQAKEARELKPLVRACRIDSKGHKSN